MMERDMETLKKQQSITVDQLRLQTENLETALKTERMLLTEEKYVLTPLRHEHWRLAR